MMALLQPPSNCSPQQVGSYFWCRFAEDIPPLQAELCRRHIGKLDHLDFQLAHDCAFSSAGFKVVRWTARLLPRCSRAISKPFLRKPERKARTRDCLTLAALVCLLGLTIVILRLQFGTGGSSASTEASHMTDMISGLSRAVCVPGTAMLEPTLKSSQKKRRICI